MFQYVFFVLQVIFVGFQYYHKTTYIDVENVDSLDNEFYLTLSFSTIDTEERVESLVYDLGNFFAAAGGNLGLFLGFSCLSGLLTSLELIFQYVVKK